MASPKSEIRKEIADLINRIKEQSDRIGMQREIPQMELDLILHRIEELHRKTVVWSYLNEQPEIAPGSEILPPVVPVPLPPAEDKIIKNDIQAEKFEAPTNPEPVVTNTPVENKKEPVSEPTPVVPVEVNLSDRTEASVVPTPLNAKPATQNQKQLKDIRSFIGFNEKLMYIRQVFGGDNAAYEEALNKINAMHSHAEAEAYLSVLAGSYKWNPDNEPVAIFLQTVKRRFS